MIITATQLTQQQQKTLPSNKHKKRNNHHRDVLVGMRFKLQTQLDKNEQLDATTIKSWSTSTSPDVLVYMYFNPIPSQRTGLSGAPTLVALTSEESHYSIVKVTRMSRRFLFT